MTQKRLIIRQGQNKRSIRFRNFENDRLRVLILRALDFACLTYFNFWALIMILFYSLFHTLTMGQFAPLLARPFLPSRERKVITRNPASNAGFSVYKKSPIDCRAEFYFCFNALSNSLRISASSPAIAAGLSSAAVARADGKQQKTYFEIGLFALFWLTGASIGLIAQVLQTNGSLTDGMLLWALFSLPLLSLSGKKLLPLIWLPLLIFSLCLREDFWRYYTSAIDWIYTHLSSSPAVVGGLLIAFYTLLATTGGLLNILSKRRFPVFAVWRGYAEVLAYLSAFWLPVVEFSFATFAVGVIFFTLATAFYYRSRQAKMLNFNITMIGITFLNAACQLFGSLLATGLVFLAAGIFLLTGVFVCRHINKLFSRGKNE